ncbi:MAG: sulfurtransferase [Cyanobacteria bacterium J06634_6]
MSQYAHPEVLVSTQWLSDHLHDDNLQVVEVEMTPASHQSAHIPGAVFWHIPADLLKPNLRQNLDTAAMQALLARSGITPKTTVIAYGSFADTGGWIFWLLKACGHNNVLVLDGGYQKWVSEGHSVVEVLTPVEPTQYTAQPLNSSLWVSYAEIQANFGSAEQVLVDVRTEPEYRGEIFMLEPPKGSERAGHISGAIHVEHSLMFNEDGTFKSFEALKALFTDRGITPEKTVIPYCAIGARSACVWFVLTYLLGYPDVCNYEGSWNEWSQVPNSQVESDY